MEWLRRLSPGQVLLTKTSADLETQLDEAERWGPTCVSSAPGFLVRASPFVTNRLRARVQHVLYGGAAMDQSQRSTVMTAFGVQSLIAFYPTTDAGALGVSPTDDGRYLTFSETHFIEVLDKNGLPVDTGQEGDVVVTALDVTAAPLIRYRIGDRATRHGSIGNRQLISGIRRTGEARLGSTLIPLEDISGWLPRLHKEGLEVDAIQVRRRVGSGGIDQPVIRVAAPHFDAGIEQRVIRLLREQGQVAYEIDSAEIASPIVEQASLEVLLEGEWKVPLYVDESTVD